MLRSITAAALLVAAGAPAALGQTITWNVGDGLWNVAANWNPMTVPISPSHIAVLGGSSAYAVTLNTNPNINQLQITNPSAALNMNGGLFLLITGAGGQVLNNGIYTINAPGSNTGTFLRFDVSGLITGSGRIALNANPANLDTATINSNGTTITLDTAQTISGVGRIPAALINNGAIRADSSGNILELYNGAKTNNGVMTATAGGTLRISVPILQEASGHINAAGNDVLLNSTTITSGALTATAGGRIRVLAGTTDTLSDVATSGPIDIEPGAALLSTGVNGFPHSGTITINTAAANVGTYFRFDHSGPLSGNIILNANAANLDTSYLQTNGTVVTLTSGSTISGFGRIYANLVNNGTIQASGAGGLIDFVSIAKTNNNLMTATGGATLKVTSIPIAQGPSGQLVIDGAGSTINLISTTISGGTLSATNAARINIPAGVTDTFNGGLATSGPIDIIPGAALLINQAGGWTHLGAVNINSTAANVGTYLRFDQSGTLTGGGSGVTLNLNANLANLDTSYIQTNGTVLTLAPDATVQGNGRIHASIINNGLIQTSGANGVMEFLTNAKTNNATISATGGATLKVTNIPITQNAPGHFSVDGPGSSIILTSTTMTGGTLSATNSARINIPAGVTDTFNGGLTTSGPLDINPGAALLINQAGGWTHQGVVNVNPTAANVGTYLRFDQSGTLTGGVTVNLNANLANLDTSYIQTNGTVLTIAPDATVQGNGRIHANIINNGLIQTSGATGLMEFLTNTKTNNATISASGGATLKITNIPFTQSATGTLSVDGSGGQLLLTSTTMNGGSATATNGARLNIPASLTDTFNGLNTSGPLDLHAGAVALSTGATGWVHNGVFTVNSEGSSVGTYFRFDHSGTYSGTGTLTLNANPANLDTAYLQTNGTTWTIAPTQSLTGRGRLYGTFIVQGLISPGVNPGGTANIGPMNGSLTLAPSATVSVDALGAAAGQYDQITGNSSINLAGASLQVAVDPGYAPQYLDTLTIVSGSSRTGQFGTVSLPPPPSGRTHWRLIYTPTSVHLRVLCRVDSNDDGVINIQDFLAFLALYSAADPQADINRDGVINIQDFLAFLAGYAASCS